MNRNRIALGILAADVVATLLTFARLPAQMPTHWGLSGEADGFSSRLMFAVAGPAMLAFFWALIPLTLRIDPLASRPLSPDAPPAERGAFVQLCLALMALSAAGHIGLMLHFAGIAQLDKWGRFLLPAMLLAMGNFLPRVRPNYFAGVRTPWTLASETVWRRTHRLAGKLFVIGGLLYAVVLLVFLPAGFLIIVLLAGLPPIVASYVWWREEQRAAH